MMENMKNMAPFLKTTAKKVAENVVPFPRSVEMAEEEAPEGLLQPVAEGTPQAASTQAASKVIALLVLLWMCLSISALVLSSIAIHRLDASRGCSFNGRGTYRGVAIAALVLWFVPRSNIMWDLAPKVNVVLEAVLAAMGAVGVAMATKNKC